MQTLKSRASLLICLLTAFSLTTACTAEKERDDKNPDASHQEETDTETTDIQADTQEPEDTQEPDVEADTEPTDTQEPDVEPDVEEDTQEPDAEPDADVDPPREPCTIEEDTDQVIVSCPDGTQAIFIASLANDTDDYCERVPNDNGPDTIQCLTTFNVNDVLNDQALITSPLAFAYLAYVTRVNQQLKITAPGLISFTVPSLQTISGVLSILDNPSLTSISFPELTHATRGLYIERNDILPSIEGLNKLTFVGGSLDIKNNPLLTNFEGLDALETITGNFEVMANATLTSPTGVHELKTIGGYIRFAQNPSLVDLNGLENITSLGNYIAIMNNVELCYDLVEAWIADFKTAAPDWDKAVSNTGNKTCA